MNYVGTRFWVLAAATTNLEYTLRVTDTLAGVTKTYFNPLGVSAPAIVDTNAFDTCGVTGATTAPTDTQGVGTPEPPSSLRSPEGQALDLD